MGLILNPEDWMGELQLWTEGWVLGRPCGAGERLSRCGGNWGTGIWKLKRNVLKRD